MSDTADGDWAKNEKNSSAMNKQIYVWYWYTYLLTTSKGKINVFGIFPLPRRSQLSPGLYKATQFLNIFKRR